VLHSNVRAQQAYSYIAIDFGGHFKNLVVSWPHQIAYIPGYAKSHFESCSCVRGHVGLISIGYFRVRPPFKIILSAPIASGDCPHGAALGHAQKQRILEQKEVARNVVGLHVHV
jgi:hypothetical protein